MYYGGKGLLNPNSFNLLHCPDTVSTFVAALICEGFTGLGLKGIKEKTPKERNCPFPPVHLVILIEHLDEKNRVNAAFLFTL